jgi:hypothetical protein
MPSPSNKADWSRYNVGSPESFDSFPTTGAAQSDRTMPPRRLLAGAEIEQRAVWVVHGMGQQIPFETLDSVTEGLLRTAANDPLNQDLIPTARSVRIGDQVIQRVELTIHRKDKPPVDVHLYEAYWAPLTEGVARLNDVISFLLDGGSRGILNSLKTFKRAMFGGICDFKIRKRVPFYIVMILLLLVSLAFINAVIVAASAKKLQILGSSLAILAPQWPFLTALAGTLSAVVITYGATLYIAMMRQSPDLPRAVKSALAFSSWLGTILASLGIMTGALLMFLIVWNHWKPAWLASLHYARLQALSTLWIILAIAIIAVGAFARARTRSAGGHIEQSFALDPLLFVACFLHIAAVVSPFVVSRWQFNPLLRSLPLVHLLSNAWWVWPFLILISSQIRTLLVEYVGDVAIYVTANKLDRFNDVRQKIKQVALQSASAVYLSQAKDGSHFQYEKIAIIGHSLGSVIAYDTLNSLINDDRLSGGKLRVPERTALFETFGSPLNKVAFLFTIQGTDSFQIREQLAESVQPLITDYAAYRKFPWINVRSPHDIISGEVYMYDWCAKNCAAGASAVPQISPDERAAEQVDPDACVALAAHVEYWKNTLIWNVLYDHITR